MRAVILFNGKNPGCLRRDPLIELLKPKQKGGVKDRVKQDLCGAQAIIQACRLARGITY